MCIRDIISGVYKIPCGSCQSKYVGQTRRNLDIRLKEHARDLRKMKDTSAVAQHIKDNPTHRINFQNASLIHIEPRCFPRKFMEGLFINAESEAMNQNDGKQINSIWTSTLLPLLNSK